MSGLKQASVWLAGWVLSVSAASAMVFTPGEQGVSDRGAATYTLPLQVPPGAVGMEPRLSLQYNSQSGNGIFGVGVSLNGLSTLTRCARTIAQDGAKGSVNYDGNDRLCLDGQRLMVVAGSYGADNAEYRLEHDNFSRILGKGSMGSGGAWFEVTQKNGTVMQYGASADSRIAAQGKSVIAVWALYRSIDTSQNYLEWRYTQNTSNGEWYPDRILYTGNLGVGGSGVMPTFAEVRFITEARPDQIPLYRADSKTQLTQRISRIETYESDFTYTSLVREYRLAYDLSPNSQRSRLTQVTECADAAANCLQPTTLAWQASGSTPGYQWTPFVTSYYMGWNGADVPYNSMDINGDGKNEVFQSADGWDNIDIGQFNGTDFSHIDNFNVGLYDVGTRNRLFHMDVNGDGLADFVLRNGTNAVKVCLSSIGCSTFYADAFLDMVNYDSEDPNNPAYSNQDANRMFVMDVNADGRADLVTRDRLGRLTTWLSNGSSFDNIGQSNSRPDNDEEADPLYTVLDMNGDGYPDLVNLFNRSSGPSASLESRTGTGGGFGGAVTVGTVDDDVYTFRLMRADINGDGLDDLIACQEDGNRAVSLISTGSGFYNAGQTNDACPKPGPAGGGFVQVEVVDVNGDGRDDIVTVDAYTHVGVWLSNGTTFTYGGMTTLLSGGITPPNGVTFADVNGDGRADLVTPWTYPTGVGTAWSLTHTWPDVVRTVNNGIGARAVFDYDYLSYGFDGSLYVKDAPTAYPGVSLQYPMLVAKALTTTNLPNTPSNCWSIGPLSQCSNSAGISEPNPMVNTTQYRYGGLKAEQGTGRGLLGFRWIEATQVQTGITTRTEYLQSFPLTGMPSSVVTRVPSGGNAGVIKQVTHTNNTIALPGGRYFSYLAQTVESSWDLNGAARPVKTLTNTYECTTGLCYGNLTQTASSATDGYSETQAFQYSNDTTHWILGLPTHIDVSKTAPGVSAQTHAMAFSYDTLGRLTKDITEPGGTAAECLAKAYAYDSRGNRNSSTTRECEGGEGGAFAVGDPAYFAPRTTLATYGMEFGYVSDPYMRFPGTIKNAAGQVEYQYHDARFGGAEPTWREIGYLVNDPYQQGYEIGQVKDEFGRASIEMTPDFNLANHYYVLCSTSGACTNAAKNAGAVYAVRNELTENDTETLNGPRQWVYYDQLNRQVFTETEGFALSGTPPLIASRKTYDSLGRLLTTSRPYYSGQTVYTFGPTGSVPYDILGRVKEEISEEGKHLAYTYNGVSTAVTNDKGQVTTKTINSRDEVVQITDALSHSLTHHFDGFGNLVQTDDALGNHITLQYDKRNRKTQLVDPDLGQYTYAYNAAGELLTQTDPKQQTTIFQYDALSRMIKRSEPDLVAEWSYDRNFNGSRCKYGVGQICQNKADNGYLNTQTFDSAGRKLTATTVIGGTSFAITNDYDEHGKIASQTYPTGFQVINDYNDLGYLKTVRNGTNSGTSTPYWQADARDAEGHILQQHYGNGIYTNVTYEGQSGRITSLLAGAGNGVQNLQFSWEMSTGNLLSRTDQNQNLIESLSYDSLNRLTQSIVNASAVSPAVTTTFGYDALGNLTCKSDLSACSAGSPNYTYGATVTLSGQPTRSMPHAVASLTGTVHGASNPAFGYDFNGNMVSGAGHTHTYTSFNMPLTLAKSGFSDQFTYGPDHQRVKQLSVGGGTTRELLYLHPDQANGLLYERETWNATPTHNHYVTANGEVVALVTLENSTWTTKYFHHDSLGSLSTITDATGAVLERMAYDSWGKRRFANGTTDPGDTIHADPTVRYNTDRGYTNHEMLDELGLIHMNGRVYDPAIARFITPDPTVPNPEWMQDYNHFSYVQNNPFAYTDPTGFGEESSVDSAEGTGPSFDPQDDPNHTATPEGMGNLAAQGTGQKNDPIWSAIDCHCTNPPTGRNVEVAMVAPLPTPLGPMFAPVGPAIGGKGTPGLEQHSKSGFDIDGVPVAEPKSLADQIYVNYTNFINNMKDVLDNKAANPIGWGFFMNPVLNTLANKGLGAVLNILDQNKDKSSLPDDAWNRNAPRQVEPGIKEVEQSKFNPRTGELERSTARYDEYGRQVSREDRTNHGYADHTNPHDHTTEYGPGYGPNGKETRTNR